MSEDIDFVYRDFNTPGDPSSGESEPDKRRIRRLLKQMQGVAAAGVISKKTLSLLNGVTPPNENYGGVVYNDPTPGNNGYYVRTGGVWEWVRGLPYQVITLENTGAGTGNAIEAESDVTPPPASNRAVYFLNITEINESAEGVTLDVNEAGPKPVLTIVGGTLPAETFQPDMVVMLTDAGDEYRLLSGLGQSEEFNAAAEVHAARAEFAANRAELARDASFADGNRYATVADGLTSGDAQFLVVGSGDISATAYERVDAANADQLGPAMPSVEAYDRLSTNDGRQEIWLFLGDGDPAQIPVEVSEDLKILVSRSAQDGTLTILGDFANSQPDGLAYVAAGALRVIGAGGADRVLNNDAGKTWISAIPFFGSALALYEDNPGGDKHLVRVAYEDGTIYPDGEVTGWSDDGQSNGEAQAGSGVALLNDAYPWSDRLRMSNLGVRLGLVTTGGTSIELDPNDITGVEPLADAIEGTGTHGTTAVASAIYAYAAEASERTQGWVPNMLAFGNAEGGQFIANLLNTAGPTYYGFDNIVAAVTRFVAVLAADNQRFVYRWMNMAQGESDAGDAALGSKHELYRSQVEAAIQPITGQPDPLRMLSAQMSNFLTNSAHVRSILDYALTNETDFGNFWCLGPTYCYPFSDDWLHHTSVGHQMRGELFRVAARTVENDGVWQPLHMVSASVTGANEITVVLSEDAIHDDAAGVAAITNKGIVVPARTVTDVTVTGDQMVITTSDPAAGATTVQAALSGHSGSRAEATIPRSTIRSVTSYGTHTTGAAIRKWLAHQEVSIT